MIFFQMSSLLVHSRKYLRSSVTKLFNDNSTCDSLSPTELQNLSLKVEELSRDLNELDRQIIENKFTGEFQEKDLIIELENCDKYKDKLREMKCLIANVRQTESSPPSPGPSSDPSGDRVNQVRSLLKSPTAPLPVFSSLDGENLELFFTNFEDTLSKFNYAEYDKFLLLKQQIKGKASLLIDSLDPDMQTYGDAKELLMSAFATSSLQKFNIIKQMSEMKLTYADEPFKYISDIKKIQQAFSKLKVTVEDVMQYFFLYGLNESFRNQLLYVTHNIRPSLDEIIAKFFEANERYQVTQTAYRQKKINSENKAKSSAYALLAEPRKSSPNPFINGSNQ